jgi:hypothetical protein
MYSKIINDKMCRRRAQNKLIRWNLRLLEKLKKNSWIGFDAEC